MTLEVVAAVARDEVIGFRGDMPWRGQMSGDMEHFRQLTMGHVVVMGRKTWESLPDKFRPLPGRANVVVTHGHIEGATEAGRGWPLLADLCGQGVQVMGDLALLKEATREQIRVFVIGGSALYAAALPIADRLHITRIDAKFVGDRYFPVIDMNMWRCVSSSTYTSPGRQGDFGHWYQEFWRRHA